MALLDDDFNVQQPELALQPYLPEGTQLLWATRNRYRPFPIGILMWWWLLLLGLFALLGVNIYNILGIWENMIPVGLKVVSTLFMGIPVGLLGWLLFRLLRAMVGLFQITSDLLVGASATHLYLKEEGQALKSHHWTALGPLKCQPTGKDRFTLFGSPLMGEEGPPWLFQLKHLEGHQAKIEALQHLQRQAKI